MEHLHQRYNKTLIYTYIGDILLAVNPFCAMKIYDEEVNIVCRMVLSFLDPNIFPFVKVINSMTGIKCFYLAPKAGKGDIEMPPVCLSVRHV